MGFDESVLNGGPSWTWSCLTRRKPVNSEAAGAHGGGNQQLARTLTLRNLLGLGVGSTIGAGVYVLIGTVARERTGPLLLVSFIIAGVAAALSALCYAELSSRCPSAGSAYHYAYICVGEGVAWLIGWALILEYTIGGSAVARGISPNLALFFGGPDSLPAFLSRAQVPGIGIVVDPCAAFLVLAVTVLLSLGIKESSFVQSIVTIGNIVVMLFVFVVGTYLDVKSGFPGYPKSGEWLPFGVNGLLAGSATLFFAFIGFDSVASTAEEVENPQRDLPIGIGASLSICCLLYVLVSWAVVGLVKYDAMDPDTPISSAFASHGMQWAMYVVTFGAVTALCATLMGSLLPQPRILMAMARDGLLPPFFSDVDSHTQVPLKSTIATGLVAAVLAFLMNVDELAGMVSVGTLLAFTTVAISILILRYIPPVTAPVPVGMQKTILKVSARRNEVSRPPSDGDTVETPLVANANSRESEKVIRIRRRIAAYGIVFACVGVVMLAVALTAAPHVSRSVEIALCVIGSLLLVCSLAALYVIGQDDGRHSFGNSGGFICPLVPLLPIGCVFINTYLLVNLSGRTWLYVAVWLVVGVVVYLFYGRKNSKLVDVVYVPNAIVDEIYREQAERIDDS